MEQIFQPGDDVYHASNPKIIMVVELVKDNDVYCSWLDPKTGEKREGHFSKLTLRKVNKGPHFSIFESLP